ncbi:MAG: hypothetical protein ACK55Z_01145 [bacterium]
MDCWFSFDIYSGFLLQTGQPHRGVIACCSGREDSFERCLEVSDTHTHSFTPRAPLTEHRCWKVSNTHNAHRQGSV